MVDERGEDLLSGYPGDSKTVGRFALPNVECSVCAGRKIDGSPGPLDARRTVACVACPGGWGDDSGWAPLAEAREALGRCRVGGGRAGSDVVGVEVHCGDRPSVGASQ